jgi:hypothetical protein
MALIYLVNLCYFKSNQIVGIREQDRRNVGGVRHMTDKLNVGLHHSIHICIWLFT